jgi:hypothetical protein
MLIFVIQSEINEYREKFKNHENKYNEYVLKRLETDEDLRQLDHMLTALEEKRKLIIVPT